MLEQAATGLTNAAIGDALYISPRTVAQHLRSVYNKLGVNSRAAAVARWANLQNTETQPGTTRPSPASTQPGPAHFVKSTAQVRAALHDMRIPVMSILNRSTGRCGTAHRSLE